MVLILALCVRVLVMDIVPVNGQQNVAQFNADVIASSTLLGVPVQFRCNVQWTYEVTLDFVLHGTPYTFNITKWRSSGMAKFIRLFYSRARDVAKFGQPTYTDEGELVTSPTSEQKTMAVLQASYDILQCVDLIMTKYKSSVLDYASWYRESHKEEDTYSDYVTKLACHFIVHTNMLAPNIAWEVVKFPNFP